MTLWCRSTSTPNMPALNIEHVACNVTDPAAMAAWYATTSACASSANLRRRRYIHFLADANGHAVIEIYSNAADPVPDYSKMHPLRFHVAFATMRSGWFAAALVAAGATAVDDQTLPDGSRLIMLRDPWGLPLQLCKRTTPLLVAG